MKKLVLISIAFLLLMSLSAFAQYGGTQGSTSDQSSTMDKSAKKSVTLSGKIGDDGKTFTDKDGKSWTISNPDAVKGHEGHDVKIHAHENAASNELRVTSVKMKSEKKETMKKDEMQK
jgi:hypothetical protein